MLRWWTEPRLPEPAQPAAEAAVPQQSVEMEVHVGDWDAEAVAAPRHGVQQQPMNAWAQPQVRVERKEKKQARTLARSHAACTHAHTRTHARTRGGKERDI